MIQHEIEILNTKQNYYHKPQFSLRHFWTINDALYLSNIAYLSIGNGGGTGLSGNSNNYDNNGQYNLQQAYNSNIDNLDMLYSAQENKAGTYLEVQLIIIFGMGD